MEILFIVFIILLIASVYFLPTIVAKVRKQPNFASVLVLNTFLGWSFIGWVVSLVWAVKRV